MRNGRGNRGEWSEVYAALTLWTQGYFVGSTILLEEDPLRKWALKSVEVPTHLPGISLLADKGELFVVDKKTRKRWPKQYCNEVSTDLFQRIISAKKTTFTIPRKSKLYKLLKIGAGTTTRTKSDLFVSVYDPLTCNYYKRGFNVKSHLGARSTLLNASSRTNFKFRLMKTHPRSVRYIKPRACMPTDISAKALEFVGMDTQFKRNLELIDSNLPFILSWILVWYYQYGLNLSFYEVAHHLAQENPCKVENKTQYYSLKLKEFLIACGLGLSPGQAWNGSYEADGGYIVITNTGSLLAFYIIDNELKSRLGDYLLKKSYLDTPSTKRHGFGWILKEECEESAFVNLNLQIRLHF
jgi:type II restriction enzyme